MVSMLSTVRLCGDEGDALALIPMNEKPGFVLPLTARKLFYACGLFFSSAGLKYVSMFSRSSFAFLLATSFTKVLSG